MSDKFKFSELKRATEQEFRRLIKIMGVTARNFFTKSFRDGGFTDENFEKWQPRKIEQRYLHRGKTGKRSSKLTLTKAAKNDKGRAVLVQTGDLRRSIRYVDVSANMVQIVSDLPYAAVHNYGEHAGRGQGFKMPKREFVGHSAQLDSKIRGVIRTRIDKIFH